MNTQTYSILHLEDSSLDAEFVRQRFERSELSVEIEQVTDRTEFISKLQSRAYDVILSDYKVPHSKACKHSNSRSNTSHGLRSCSYPGRWARSWPSKHSGVEQLITY